MHEPLNLRCELDSKPIPKLISLILSQAIYEKAECIILELDLELHLKAQAQYEAIDKKYRRPSFSEAIFQKRITDYFRFWSANFRKLNISRRFFEMDKLPTALRVIYIVNGVQNTMSSASGNLFEDIVQILQIAAGISPKAKGEVSSVIETIKPISKWTLESRDLTKQIQLKRIS